MKQTTSAASVHQDLLEPTARLTLMSVAHTHVQMVPLVLMASINTLVNVYQALLMKTVAPILMIAVKILV